MHIRCVIPQVSDIVAELLTLTASNIDCIDIKIGNIIFNSTGPIFIKQSWSSDDSKHSASA